MAAAEPVSDLAGRQLGRYEVLSQLASGGMATVYIARALGVAGFERLVAIKVLHPHLAYEEEFVSMFLDEARLAARIRHPNVVPTLDISDTDGDGFFLVMEYIEGDHFGALLGMAARGGERIPAEVTARIVLDALAGLGAAHELHDDEGEPLNLVHRDISPHNILVGKDGIGRLTDFGVAKAEKRLTSTRAGQFKGKLSYMAPEQASTGHADQRSDLFSMGIILWEALTGRRLFRGENNAATLNKILNEPIPAPSALWGDLGAFDAVLRRALQRDADDRFQDADEFSAALEEAAAAHSGISKRKEVGKTVRQWLGDRMKEQTQNVRAAIDRFGHSDYSATAVPLPRDSLSNMSLVMDDDDSSRSFTRSFGSRSISSVNTMSGEMSSMTGSHAALILDTLRAEGHERRKKQRIVMGAVLVALLFGGALAVMLRPEDPEPLVNAGQNQTGQTQIPTEPSAEVIPEVAARPEPTPELAPEPEVAPDENPEVIDEGSDPEAEIAEVEAEPTAMRRRPPRWRTGSMRNDPPPVVEEAAIEVVTPPEPEPPPVMTPTPMTSEMGSTGSDLEFNPYL